MVCTEIDGTARHWSALCGLAGRSCQIRGHQADETARAGRVPGVLNPPSREGVWVRTPPRAQGDVHDTCTSAVSTRSRRRSCVRHEPNEGDGYWAGPVSEPDIVGPYSAADIGREPHDRAARPIPPLVSARTSRMPRSLSEPSPAAPTDGFEAFFRHEHPRLLAVAVAMVGDREAARELVQDALLKAYSSWPKVARLESPGGWTRRVLINLSIDVQRRRRRERRALGRSQQQSAVDAPPLPSPGLWSAVRDLPGLQRSSVVLHYVDDMPIAEVATVLGVSPGSVKTSLSRARSALAPTLSAHLHGEVES